MSTAIVFPGQGCQFVGMGKKLYEKSLLVKEIINEAQDVLRCDLKKIMFEGPECDLNNTKYTQPAIFIISYILYKLHCVEVSNVAYFAGHSLGEFNAIWGHTEYCWTKLEILS